MQHPNLVLEIQEKGEKNFSAGAKNYPYPLVTILEQFAKAAKHIALNTEKCLMERRFSFLGCFEFKSKKMGGKRNPYGCVSVLMVMWVKTGISPPCQ